MVLIKSNHEENSSKILFNKFLAFQISFPLLGGLLFGYNTGVISGALLLLKKEFNPSVITQEIIVTSTIVAAALGSMLGGFTAEGYGRKITLITSSLFLTVGAIVMGMAIGIKTVITGRCIIGIGIGLASTSSPIYIAEVAPEEIRGRLILLYQSTIAGGQFLAAVINALFYNYANNHQLWRFMLGFPAIIAFIQGFGFIFIPESHRWLILKNKLRKAEKIILKEGRIKEESIHEYISDIVHLNEGGFLALSQKMVRKSHILNQMVYCKTVRKSLFIGCVIQMIGQLVGINGVIYYSSSIINMAGIVNNQEVLWYTVLVMFFCFFPLLIGFVLIDRIGRRKLAIGSLIGILLSTIILAAGFQVMYNTSDPVSNINMNINETTDKYCYHKLNCEACVTMHTCGYCVDHNTSKTYCLAINEKESNVSANGVCSKKNQISKKTIFHVGFCLSKYSVIIIIGMALYLMSYNVGMGPIPWIVTSEIYPPWSRGISMSISTTVNWTFNILISMTFLSLTEWITRYGTFYVFAGISCWGFVLIYAWLLETNQKTLEEITLMLESNRISI